MARVARLVSLVAFVVMASAENTNTNRQERQSDYNPNVYGVASVARVTSRNGRISSTGGIHFFTPDGVSEYYPASISTTINGKYPSVRHSAVGASAHAGYFNPGFDWDPRQHWPMQWPVHNQYAFGDPWFNKLKIDLPRNNVRMYPSFNPFFNFWR